MLGYAPAEHRRCQQHLDSEQFRSAPRTYRQVCGRLSLRPIDHWAVVKEDGRRQLLKITGRRLIGPQSSPLRALPPALHKRYWRLGWSI